MLAGSFAFAERAHPSNQWSEHSREVLTVAAQVRALRRLDAAACENLVGVAAERRRRPPRCACRAPQR
jgi:hypothetical protein